MNWQSIYRSRKTTPEQAIKMIEDSSVVVVGLGCGEPQTLIDALMGEQKSFNTLEIVNMLPLREFKLREGSPFKIVSLFPSRAISGELTKKLADYLPCSLSSIPKLLRNGHLRVDVALVQLSPPDEHGYCSFGTSVGFTRLAAISAKKVIAEINEQMPRTLGDSFIHISQIASFIETSRPLLEVRRQPIGEAERRIGELIAELIPNGATLEIGLGAVAEGTLKVLENKRDLGIHSGMIFDGVIELFEKGVINNSRKELNKGKMVAAFLVGTEKLFRFAHNNPLLEMHTIDYVHNPAVISQFSCFIAINTALEVDLQANINAENLENCRISGTGGLLDFIRGASYSLNGKAIIALTSTSSNEEKSKIVPSLNSITVPGSEVDYIVTEYGIAQIRGKTLRQRAKALVEISHPKFREWLKKEAEKI